MFQILVERQTRVIYNTYVKALLACISLLLIAGVIYIVPSFHAKAATLLTYNTCNTPLPYKIGSVDDRFQLTQSKITQDVDEATSIWSSAEGKNLFVFSGDATLTVNFVYDQRQALTTSIDELNSELSQKNKSLSSEIAQYESDVTALKQKIAAFNSLVESYNQKGGVTQAQYNDLVKQQQQLNEEGASLNERAQQLNLSTNDYNAGVGALNSDISQFNTVISQKPEEGLYDGKKNSITIYFANNNTELIHTLTHEFGHSLGMNHVQDPQAIMYAYSNDTLVPTKADLQELSYVCRNQSAIVYYLQQFDIWLYTKLHQM